MSASSKHCLAILVAISIAVGGPIVASSAMAQSNRERPAAPESASKDGEKSWLLQIDAAKRELSDQQMTVTFTGDVRATVGDMTIHCASLIAYYATIASAGARAAQPGPNGAQWVRKLVATGAVLLKDEEKSTSADSGVFDLDAGRATLTGTVVVMQGMTVTRGERLVANLATGIWTIATHRVPLPR